MRPPADDKKLGAIQVIVYVVTAELPARPPPIIFEDRSDNSYGVVVSREVAAEELALPKFRVTAAGQAVSCATSDRAKRDFLRMFEYSSPATGIKVVEARVMCEAYATWFPGTQLAVAAGELFYRFDALARECREANLIVPVALQQSSTPVRS